MSRNILTQFSKTISSSTDSDFAALFEKHKTLGMECDHNIMAESDYINLIAQGLKAYHDAGNMKVFDSNVRKVYGDEFDYQKFYSMMAWVGLDGTMLFSINQSNSDWNADYQNFKKAPMMYLDLKNCM